MSDPVYLGFDLTSNNPSDDPRIAKAVELHVQRELEKHGILQTNQGLIAPDAIEAADRGSQIAKCASEAIAKATAASRASRLPAVDIAAGKVSVEHSVRQHFADGRIEEVTLRFKQSVHRTRLSIDSLKALIDQATQLCSSLTHMSKAAFGVFIAGIKRVVIGALEYGDEASAPDHDWEVGHDADYDDSFPITEEERD